MIITATFECRTGHPNEVSWAVLPSRTDSMAALIVEQGAFVRAFNAKCPVCGAPAKNIPKVTIKD